MERVKLQHSGEITSVAVGTSRTYTLRASGNNSGKQRTVICYNCKGEGHMSKQCTKPRGKRMIHGFMGKSMLVQSSKQVVKFYLRRNFAFLADQGKFQHGDLTVAAMAGSIPFVDAFLMLC
ncbi:retrovirus-related pol polyprotein from transposon TNT 1-94 [Tanacetum coccineum]